MLDVVDGDGVAAEEGLHVTFAHQPGQMFTAAGVNDDRPGHDHDAPFLLADAVHLPGNLVHNQLDPPFARHARRHETKFMRPLRAAAGVARFGLAHRAHAVAADDHPIARLQITEERAARRLFILLDNNDAVHALVLHPQPAATRTSVG